MLGQDGLDSLLQQASVTGELAQEVNSFTDNSTSTLIVAIVTSAWIAAWAGRNLVIVLAATASITNRLRSEFGLAGSTTSWALGAVAFTAAWFAVMWVLPKGTPDPGAVIPGAALVGL